jgi:hypothetical protein
VTDSPDDRALTAYKAVRTHELMLNEAVARFEHARLTPLIALNGGALIAFLTLIGALLGKNSGGHPNLWLSGFASGAWVVGLVAAELAITWSGIAQKRISASHRLGREGLEDELMGDDRLAMLLRGPVPETDGSRTVEDWPEEKAARVEERKNVRKALHSDRDKYEGRFKWCWRSSVFLFLVGAGLALAAVLVSA